MPTREICPAGSTTRLFLKSRVQDGIQSGRITVEMIREACIDEGLALEGEAEPATLVARLVDHARKVKGRFFGRLAPELFKAMTVSPSRKAVGRTAGQHAVQSSGPRESAVQAEGPGKVPGAGSSIIRENASTPDGDPTDDATSLQARTAPQEVLPPGRQEVKLLPIEALRPHPLNSKTYEHRDEPEWEAGVVESAKAGHLAPVVITKEGVILSGHRRCEALKKAGLKSVPTVTMAVDDTDLALVFFNRSREKTTGERMREAAILEARYSKDATNRRKAGVRVNPSDGVRAAQDLGSDLTQGPTSSGPGHRSDEAGRTATKVAAAVGMKPSTLKKVRHVLSSAFASPDLKAKLKRDEISPDAAYKLTRAKEREAAGEKPGRRRSGTSSPQRVTTPGTAPGQEDAEQPKVDSPWSRVEKAADLVEQAVELISGAPPRPPKTGHELGCWDAINALIWEAARIRMEWAKLFDGDVATSEKPSRLAGEPA